MSNPYDLLGLAPDADDVEVAAAYERERARIAADYAAATDLGERASDLEQRLTALDNAYQAVTASRRPALAVATTQQRSLDRVAGQACPSCGTPNPQQAIACLKCGQQFSRSCPRCRWPVPILAQVCPRCESVIKEYDQRAFQEAAATDQRTTAERQMSRVRVAKLEDYHQARAWHGAVFWLVAFVLFWGVIALAIALMAYGSR